MILKVVLRKTPPTTFCLLITNSPLQLGHNLKINSINAINDSGKMLIRLAAVHLSLTLCEQNSSYFWIESEMWGIDLIRNVSRLYVPL